MIRSVTPEAYAFPKCSSLLVDALWVGTLAHSEVNARERTACVRTFAAFQLRQIDTALRRLGIAAVKKRGVADRAHADAAAFVGNLRAESGAFIALGAEETKLYELVRAELFLQFGVERRSESAFA
jgi:hypothetical protein